MKQERPYDEAWWARELHRNEKLMDRYLAALADNPDLAKFPGDLHRDMHSNPEEPSVDPGADLPSTNFTGLEAFDGAWDEFLDPEDGLGEALANDAETGFEDNPADNQGYADIARLARGFAVAVLSLGPPQEIPEILFLSAPKVGANLAGGHGLGYDDETLCGNIVKCRWALADCEFCREMLEHLAQQRERAEYRSLAAEGARLSELIRQRIARLRSRVWW